MVSIATRLCTPPLLLVLLNTNLPHYEASNIVSFSQFSQNGLSLKHCALCGASSVPRNSGMEGHLLARGDFKSKHVSN